MDGWMDGVDQQGSAASGYRPSRHRRGASETVIGNPPAQSSRHSRLATSRMQPRTSQYPRRCQSAQARQWWVLEHGHKLKCQWCAHQSSIPSPAFGPRPQNYRQGPRMSAPNIIGSRQHGNTLPAGGGNSRGKLLPNDR